MGKLNSIEPEHIQRLKPHELIGLLRKLLYSEAKRRNAEVHVPVIEVRDEGEDGRWKGDAPVNEYIPNAFTIYQSKAQDLSPAECKSELIQQSSGGKTELKPKVAQVLDEGGCYIFFCGHLYTTTTLIDRRLRNAREALRAIGRRTWKTDQIRFLDAGKIAAWTNLHMSAVVYVAECCQLRLPVNFRTWENWHKDQPNRTRYHSNAKLNQYAADLRAHLSKPGSIARISGLSGLGKTRLAFETLRLPDDPANVERLSLSQSTAYIDIEENNKEEVFAVVRQLADAGYSGTLVVDNCERTTVHDKLAEIVGMEGSQLTLLTLDYEPERPPFAGFLHVPLEPEMMTDVIPAILGELPRAKMLTEQQRQHIATFAHGFPQIAVLMVAAGDTMDWARLDRGRLAQKIAHGRDAPTDKSRQLIRALALFTHVGFDGRVAGQKEFVRQHLCQNISEDEFEELCKPFKDRKVLQSAGDFAFVAPPPLAVALAADWWESVATERRLIELFPHMESCGLRPYFCNQVERLHLSENAETIAAKLCGDGGPLGDAEVLNTVAGSQLFRAIVELNPSAATECLHRVFAAKSNEELVQFATGRRNLIWALEKLCWERATFAKAAEVLLCFAAAEVENIGNNATGQFKQLFHVLLPGTETPLNERLVVIEEGLQTTVAQKRKVCVEALGSALKAHHFSRMGGAEVRGSGLPRQDYTPTHGEIRDYWLTTVRLLKRMILEKAEQSELAKKTLGENLWEILKPYMLLELEPAFKEIAESESRYWPEALASINRILEHFRGEYDPGSLERLEKWREWITPTDLLHRLELAVTRAPYEHRQTETGHFIDIAEENATRLAEEVVHKETEWIAYLPHLLEGEQRQAWQFGKRLGELHQTPHEFISKCMSELRDIDPNKQNAGLLIGFLAGIKSRDLVRETLDKIQADEVLRHLLVKITVGCRPQKPEFERIIGLVASGKLPPRDLRWFSYGSVTDSLSPQELIDIFDPLVRHNPEARAPIFNISFMYSFQRPDRWQECRSFIKALISSDGFLKSIDSSHDGYEWEQHVRRILGDESDERFALNQTKQILDAQTEMETRFALDLNARNVVTLILEKYAAACWPAIGEVILSEKWYTLSLLFKNLSFDEKKTSPLWVVPTSIVTEWARKHRFAIARIFHLCPLFEINEDGSYSWHPTVLALLDIGFDEHWASTISANLYSYGSVGSRVPHVEKRIALLRQLKTRSSTKVRQMADVLISSFEADREREKKSDAERAAGIF